MNGKAPPADDLTITALQTYAFWLAKGAPVGMPLPGSGHPKLKKPEQPADYPRGEKVYAQNCALCHGADGLCQRAGDKQVFPHCGHENRSTMAPGCTSWSTRPASFRPKCRWAKAAL